jgi:hypothetical protein
MDPTRQQFQVRPAKSARDIGDRLIWRFPLATEEGRAALAPVLAAERDQARAAGEQPPKDPETITIGYYLQLDNPDGMWAFAPVATARARASLAVAAVQRRICADLVARLGIV